MMPIADQIILCVIVMFVVVICVPALIVMRWWK